MSTHHFSAFNAKLSIRADRELAEDGVVVLSLVAGGATIKIEIGGDEDDAARLANELSTALDQARDITEHWENLPQQYDAYVSPDSQGWRGTRWRIMLEGVVPPGQPREGYPDKAVAIYELAAAMTAAGSFPPAWIEGMDWAPKPIDAQVRAFHDEGGTGLLPLPGVVYEPGDEVAWDGSVWEVRKDYGSELGVWLVIPVDPDAGRDRLVPHDQITPVTDDDQEDQ